MHFLKTLFWMVLAVILALWGRANWSLVELRLWGGLVADVRLPILILFAFLLGFLPTFLLYRARLWSLRRRLDPIERTAPVVPAPTTPAAPVVVGNGADERVATDSAAWPKA